MYIITQKGIVEAKQRHPTAAPALNPWYRVMKGATLTGFDEVRTLFPDVDRVGKFYIFNISGNQLRLVAILHLHRNKCFIREVLTHAEYDRWHP